LRRAEVRWGRDGGGYSDRGVGWAITRLVLKGKIKVSSANLATTETVTPLAFTGPIVAATTRLASDILPRLRQVASVFRNIALLEAFWML
jgi:hypothetical protein